MGLFHGPEWVSVTLDTFQWVWIGFNGSVAASVGLDGSQLVRKSFSWYRWVLVDTFFFQTFKVWERKVVLFFVIFGPESRYGPYFILSHGHKN